MIGPTLPPQLSTNKNNNRGSDEPEVVISDSISPKKVALSEQELENSFPNPNVSVSKSTVGPQLPTAPVPKKTVGPQLPITSESNRAVGPQLPSFSDSRKAVGPQLPITSGPRRTVGPQLPPGFERLESEISPKKICSPDESDDEIIGPLPPRNSDVKTSALDSKIAEIYNRAHPDKSKDKVTRGDWMTILPESRSSGDALKSISRQFKRSNVPEKDADRSLWTETPEQRLERLRGHKPTPSSDDYKNYANKRSIEQEEMITSSIDSFNDANRPKSLMEIHQESLSKKRVKKGTLDDPDHPSNNRFDRERDMSIKTLDPRKQHELLKNAGSLSDRFARGSRSKYE